MAIALDAVGGGAVTTAGTTFNVDITAAATGADCFVWIARGLQSATFTLTGWTQILVGGPASTLTCGLFYRRKVAGDTTFTCTTGSAKGCHAWVSYTGLHASTPYQIATLAANFLAKSAASVNVSTPAVTNSDATAWALGFFASRTSTSGNKVITFTPDAALTERKDQNNSGASSSIWTGGEIADSNGAVTAASHSYTAVASFSETYGGGALLYLNPASGSTAVGKDLGLVWDTRAALGDSVQAIWDVRATAAGTLQLIWNVQVVGLTTVGKDVGLIWNVRTAVGDPVQLVWNTRAAIGDPVQLTWNTRMALGDMLALVWDTRAAAANLMQLTWDVRAVLGDQIQLVWNVQFGVLTAIGKDAALVWHVRAAAGDPLQLVWNIQATAPPAPTIHYLTVPHHRAVTGPRAWRVPRP
jgi:hypothetical protein